MNTYGMRRFHFLSLAGALAALVIAAPASAGVLDLNGKASARSSSMAVPASPGGSAITPVSGRGTATLDFLHATHSACPSSPVACNASSGHCECDPFVGTVTLPKIGKGTLTLNITTDDDDSFPNGNSSCLPGTGQGTICNGASCVGIQTTGLICTAIIDEPSPGNGDVVVDANEVFYIVPSTSTGKAAGASGGGTFDIANDVKVVGGAISSETGYAVMNGVYQATP